ncbi:hypothetical protein ACJX0J_026938, partial [Zea mays]
LSGCEYRFRANNPGSNPHLNRFYVSRLFFFHRQLIYLHCNHIYCFLKMDELQTREWMNQYYHFSFSFWT